MKTFTFKMFCLRSFEVFYHECQAVNEDMARMDTRNLFSSASIVGVKK